MKLFDVSSITDSLEMQELMSKLIDNGLGELVEAFIMNENEVYTKKGRLNKSGACRVLQWKNKQLEEALKQCREVIAEAKK